ncbi:MAG: IS3 family transposase [Phycisphaerales bacterium]|nr:MAG: IS3 family transposase [Phycisphaerales bacterium]
MADLHEQGVPVAALCHSLGVSRSGYYAWKQGRRSRRAEEDRGLMPQVRAVFREHKRRYGARRVARELSSRGTPCSKHRAGRLMRDMGLEAIQPKSFRPRTTESRHRLGYSPNLLLNEPPSSGVNRVWVGDITYVPLVENGFLYLALLMDLYSRRIVGWELDGNMKESLVLSVLRFAIAGRQPGVGLIHHTDRGGQYAGNKYRRVLERARMLQSMSRADNCYDNAFMESCFGTIKRELEMERYESEPLARKEIAGYIRYYNTRRRHSSLDYLTPEEFEAIEQAPGEAQSNGPRPPKSTSSRAQEMEKSTHPQRVNKLLRPRETLGMGLAGRYPHPFEATLE